MKDLSMDHPSHADTLSERSAETAGRAKSLATTLTSATTGLLLAWALLAPTAARAVDGCLVLLCFAAPSWKAISQCVPPIRQVLRDLARGKGFPSCGMAGAGNSAHHAWASAPGNCPPQYTRVHESESGPIYTCDYSGAVAVSIEGKPFTQTWWNMSGDTVTDFSPAAKAHLGSWDTRFDAEYAAWKATLPPAPAADAGY
jgi:hypothetical protein